MRQIQPKKGPAKETIPQSPKREKKFPAGTDLTTQPTEFNPMSLEATDPKRSMASFSVEPKSPQSQRIKYKEEFEKEAAEEDYYDPIEKYPSLIISVDLFKGHGGSLGLKFEDTDVNPNSTRVIGFHDPVQKRWGWRIGDEIVAILQSRRAGDKAWFPIENFDQLYKRYRTEVVYDGLWLLLFVIDALLLTTCSVRFGMRDYFLIKQDGHTSHQHQKYFYQVYHHQGDLAGVPGKQANLLRCVPPQHPEGRYALQICLGLEECKLVMLSLDSTKICIA